MALLQEREPRGSLAQASENNGGGLAKVNTGLDSKVSMIWITSKGRGRISDNVNTRYIASPGSPCSDLPRIADETYRSGASQSLVRGTASLINSDEKGNIISGNSEGEKYVSRPVLQSRSLPAQPEMYIPEALPEGQAAFEDRKAKNYRTGVNFDAYQDIPIEIHGKDVWTNGVESFEDLKLDKIIRENVIQAGYRRPTPIQKTAIPVVSAGRDLMACAQTGSGKSAAYLLPIINKLMVNKTSSVEIQCLIISPTRELAMQINREGNMYCNGTGTQMRLICGGVAIWYQKAALKRGAHMLIATPGRLIQFIEEGHVNLKQVKYFVLDEADRMFEMGFMEQIHRIVKRLPPKATRVNIMFSATFPTQIQKAAAEYLHDYVFVAIGIVGGASGNIEQLVYEVESVEKRRKLMEILADVGQNEKILVFCSRKANADSLATYLSSLEFVATSIHSDKAQSQRDQALREFVEGKCQILVATDVAARGLDIPKVAMVINYDLPESIDEYVQRIGRTGRVGHIGKAISFFETGYDESLRKKLGKVLRDAGQLVPEWLEEADVDIDGGQTYRRRYGAVDFRRKQRNFVSNCVPVPVEADGEEW